MRSLVVEDEFICRLQMQYFLQEFGDVQFAHNGSEALEAIQTMYNLYTPYDLICVDIVLPQMNGHGVVRRIRMLERILGNTQKRVKILMTTSMCSDYEVKLAIDAGCDSYLLKPFNRDDLMSHLSKLGLIRSQTCTSQHADNTPGSFCERSETRAVVMPQNSILRVTGNGDR